MAEKSKSKLKIKIPTYIVRNEDIHLTNGEFVLYARLSFLYFRNYKQEQQEEMNIDHKKLMLQIGITDTRTLKKYFNNLYKNKLIKNKIDKFPRKNQMLIIFNSDVYNKDQHFTLMNIDIFDYIDKITEHGFRLVWYYKSHINMNDKNRDRSFCYVGYDKLQSNLKIGRTTIKEGNELLKENNLIKIKKHLLKKEEGSYTEDDELVFDRFNNHYFVSSELF